MESRSLLSKSQAAAYLGISLTQLTNLWRTHQIAGTWVGAHPRFLSEDLDAYLASRRVEAVLGPSHQRPVGPNRDGLLSKAEAADYLGTTPPHLTRLWQQRLITGYRIGGKVRFKPEDLDAYLASRRVEAVR